MIAPWLDPAGRPTDAAGWKALGAYLAKLHKIFADAGLAFGWHTHDFEFVALPDGTYPIEHILDGNSVGLELDVAWVVCAGGDPAAWLERYADRLVAVHIKDVAKDGENADQDGWADLGHGAIDWKALWPIVQRSTSRVAILEHDKPVDWRRFARNSAVAYRNLAGE